MKIPSRCLQGAALALLVGLLACRSSIRVGDGPGLEGDGVSKTEARSVGAFHAVEVDGAMSVDISSGPLSVTLAGDENLLPLVTTTIVDGKLVVHETKSIRPRTPLALTIHVPALDGVEVRGAGTLHVAGIDVPRFALDAQGASDVDLAGHADEVEVNVLGAANVRASTLAGKRVRVSLSGTGSVEVAATDALDATVMGAGTVLYRGSPTVAKNVAGLGVVKPLT